MAYRESHSTETALLSGNDVHLNFVRGEATTLVMLDLSVAFDTIDHSILLHRLSTFIGLGGTVLNWLNSF